jgi:two-component sensor histidine kinase
MSAYLGDLAAELVEHLGGGRLRVEVDVQAMDLPSEVAVPIGLVVNEFVTNACKHAFPEGRTGTIRIGLWCRGADVLVQVEDDGVGMSDNGADTPPEGLGMAVVRSMASNLEGELAVEPLEPGGTRMKVRFPAPDQADAAH